MISQSSLALLALLASTVTASPFGQPANVNPNPTSSASGTVTTGNTPSGALLPGLVTTPSPAAFSGNAFKWYYNYAGSYPPGAGLTGAEYVPQFHDSTNMDNFKKANPTGQYMLSMNEPDQPSAAGGAGANAGKAVTDHIAVFGTTDKPTYSASIGSISTCSQEKVQNIGLEYMKDWLKQCKAQNCKVDFMVVHWYSEQAGGDDATIKSAVDALTQYIKDASSAWKDVYGNNPSVWLTEYGHGKHGSGGYTPGQGQDKFLAAALPALKQLGNVDRQAYYGTTANGQIWTAPDQSIVSAILGGGGN